MKLSLHTRQVVRKEGLLSPHFWRRPRLWPHAAAHSRTCARPAMRLSTAHEGAAVLSRARPHSSPFLSSTLRRRSCPFPCPARQHEPHPYPAPHPPQLFCPLPTRPQPLACARRCGWDRRRQARDGPALEDGLLRPGGEGGGRTLSTRWRCWKQYMLWRDYFGCGPRCRGGREAAGIGGPVWPTVAGTGLDGGEGRIPNPTHFLLHSPPPIPAPPCGPRRGAQFEPNPARGRACRPESCSRDCARDATNAMDPI